MDTKPLEKFAQAARRQLHDQVRARLEQVLRTDSPELRAKAQVVAELNRQIAQSSRQAVVERVAYTWFNRFCALRYMDANRYTRLGVVSPAPGSTQPEILQEAKAGHLDDDLPLTPSARQHLFDLLAGRAPSADGQAEVYRLLLVASCNQYYEVMPFLFEKIDDYTELLMPDDLLSASSVLAAARAVLTEPVCQDVEVIGWLYQFYISEKKDEVIGAKKPIAPENIPAATQLFTPDWIVRYLVQNSLGRLWLLNRPHSRLAAQMEFYIAPDETSNFSETSDFSKKSDVLSITSPEELTVCDPAVGSGHMLTYAFDLLYAIYEEEGYNPPDIPRLILQKNLVGLEIDERAAALAAFALMMKARARDRRFFRRDVRPAITVLRPVVFTEAELDTEVAALAPLLTGSWQERPQQLSFLDTGQKQLTLAESGGMQMMREALRHDLSQFREADNVGSLLRPRLSANQLTHLHDALANVPTGQLQMFDQARRQKVLQALNQAISLAKKYAVVIANPPYMGNVNDRLKKFLNDEYKDVKSDTFSAFIVRNLELALPNGQLGFMTPFVWMFISSYEKLRQFLNDHKTITTLVQLEYSGFAGATVPICIFNLENSHKPNYRGGYVRLSDFKGADNQAPKTLEAIQNSDCGWFYRATAVDFQKIPGSPIAYWVSNRVRDLFAKKTSLSDLAILKHGMSTSDNDRFLRFWHEVAANQSGYGFPNRTAAQESGLKWFPMCKGGSYRRWFGNADYLVNWKEDGKEIKEETNRKYPYLKGNLGFVIGGEEYYFSEGITWSSISSASAAFRWLPKGFVVNNKGQCFYPHDPSTSLNLLALSNSKLSSMLLKALSPTIGYELGYVKHLPFIYYKFDINQEVRQLIDLAKNDWDSYETSWDFNTLPLLQERQLGATLAATYTALHHQWQIATREMQRLEEENNRLFINAYGLQDELTPDVPLPEITLTCNPHYRYGNPSSVNSDQLVVIGNRWPEVVADWPTGDEGLELRLLADTMREFISYAVGCMFGRYSLDTPGLILANQGETVEDYVQQVQSSHIHNSQFTIHNSSFPPDTDNAIPMLDGDWFPDDITERFKKFLRLTFGEEQYADNLAFIEAALGRDIRAYFLREFYDHHVKMYKKRPIYWLFSSPKGSFNVLIYMHRYRPDTVSVILNDYLREFRAKLTARKSHLEGVSISAATSPRDKTRALRDMADIDKILQEIREYEDDILYPLATRQISIDLDDGVKVNYNKLGPALKKVTGLSE